MNYQHIRAAYESVLIAALAPLRVFVENEQYSAPDAQSEFAVVQVNLGLTTEQALLSPFHLVRGSLVTEVFVPKGQGPGRGLELITPAIDALLELTSGLRLPGPGVTAARVGQINGPSQLALDGRPHHLTRFSCSIQARYD